MRYGAETKLSPDEVLNRARAYFGEGGKVGLPETETETGPASATFATEAGGVTVSAIANDAVTAVTILSREYDYWAERFLNELR
ncbi:MAG: hypothetical protein ACRDJH_04610 [Thermomicrobiales bacterium]